MVFQMRGHTCASLSSLVGLTAFSVAPIRPHDRWRSATAAPSLPGTLGAFRTWTSAPTACRVAGGFGAHGRV